MCFSGVHLCFVCVACSDICFSVGCFPLSDFIAPTLATSTLLATTYTNDCTMTLLPFVRAHHIAWSSQRRCQNRRKRRNCRSAAVQATRSQTRLLVCMSPSSMRLHCCNDAFWASNTSTAWRDMLEAWVVAWIALSRESKTCNREKKQSLLPLPLLQTTIRSQPYHPRRDGMPLYVAVGSDCIA